jgi:3-hydroxymyristoyl/3-hydroxydecanoyl-(acyl carrier protein) dehydratase
LSSLSIPFITACSLDRRWNEYCTFSHDLETSRIIPADHPSLAGHFPGAPMCLGAVLMSRCFSWHSRLTGNSVKSSRRSNQQSHVIILNLTNTPKIRSILLPSDGA